MKTEIVFFKSDRLLKQLWSSESDDTMFAYEVELLFFSCHAYSKVNMKEYMKNISYFFYLLFLSSFLYHSLSCF